MKKELLIGKSLVIPTKHNYIPFLISAPTMRVPMSFNIATSINAYLAMKAILIAGKNHEAINTIAIPGLCTGWRAYAFSYSFKSNVLGL